MCSLIVLAGFDPDYPLFVAANRDEFLDRRSAPPGLRVGARRRRLAPRDLQAGGTWIGVDEDGRFAALTNLAGEPTVEGAPTRGRLVDAALEAEDGVDGAIAAVVAEITPGRDNGFQLLVSDGRRTRVVVHPSRAGAEGLESHEFAEVPHVVAISNEHRPGTLDLGELVAPATAAGLSVDERLDRLEPVLRHPGDEGILHRVLKVGDRRYGTVSGSLLAVPARDPRDLRWRFAAGAPGTVAWKNYGNLGRRLVE
jgi:hypothetical protein